MSDQIFLAYKKLVLKTKSYKQLANLEENKTRISICLLQVINLL